MIKRRLDYWHTKMPYLGVRKLRRKLQDEDHIKVGRKLIKRYMDEMGIYAVYPKPNLSKRNKEHKVYPYLLRNLDINRPNLGFAVDKHCEMAYAVGFSYWLAVPLCCSC